ncbi:MAG TPA: helix-turn-helix domain-containing protein [Methanoregula sp.]|nr:helix-turn-helix domain-containing protein [Methanoregula sp.]
MEAPCQKIVWEVLPAIKAAIAAELIRQGISQAEASRMLSMAPSAVSQYLSGKRGYRIEFKDEVKRSIEELARDLIAKKEVNLVGRTCDICRQLRENDSVCDSLPGDCCGK